MPSISLPRQLQATQLPATHSARNSIYTLCDAAGGCPQPTALTPILQAIVPAVMARQPSAATPQPADASQATADAQITVAFAFLHTDIDAAQRARIAYWVATRSDRDWQHYALLVHFTHQGQQSQRLAEARAKTVIAVLNGLGLHGIPVTTMTDGLPHRVVGITHVRPLPARSTAAVLVPSIPTAIGHFPSATTVPTASAADAAPAREESTPYPETH